ncbi:MAG: ThuA domain-containing protein [Verrucomicrobia bacterium]|nr:ThuA domain-containing protein [Verrucomicrobiota bacterium]
MKSALHRLSVCLVVFGTTFNAVAAEKKIVIVAGRPSHGPGDHEHNAGCLVLQKCLDQVPGVKTAVYSNGWPKEANAFDGADAIFLFMDGGGGHPAIQSDRLKTLGELMRKGVGLGCAHYAVEVPKDKGGPEFLDWIGGYYETAFSTNPHWDADIKDFPKHPITRGVKPFKIRDEWYFNMRFRPEMKGVTPILVAKPTDETRQGRTASPRGPYPHIVAASGRSETLMWAVERADGGRGFGFTGGHMHANWANANFRKVVLNALLWLAKMDVPADGVQSTLPLDEFTKHLDPKGQPAATTNITGAWEFQVETSGGTGTPSFTFVQAGPNVVGTYKGLFGEAEFSGSLRNQELRFSFDVTFQDQAAAVTYTGKVESADSLKGTVRFGDIGEGTWTAKKVK